MRTIVIQNVDRNTSPRDYKDLAGLAVTSMFRTLQGEGPLAGRPAVFLRLAGCNYGSKTDFCLFCDTSFQFDAKQIIGVPELLAKLLELRKSPKDILVITGGEPTLQTALLGLIVQAKGYFSSIQIETNGTQPKFFVEAEARGITGKDFITVVSPKANERLKSYPQVHQTVKWWASDFKFVVSADTESAHHTIPDWALHHAEHGTKDVWVSPMTVYRKSYSGEVSSAWDAALVDQEATAANYAYAARYALEHNLLLSVQVHTLTAIA